MPARRHGKSRSDDATYRIWKGMMQRCRDQPRYAGRGIKVCDRWHRFENFLEDMGPRPPGMQIDRIDNDGDYTPANCRWTTRLENMANSTRSKKLTVGGTTRTVREWASLQGLTSFAIRQRLIRGATPEQAIQPGILVRYVHPRDEQGRFTK